MSTLNLMSKKVPVSARLCGKTLKAAPYMMNAFETRRWPYLAVMPLSWLIIVWVMAKKGIYRLFGRRPKINCFWFDGQGVTCRNIKENVASWKALDLIYNYSNKGELIDDFWVNMVNAQAVRNRLRLVRQKLFGAALVTRQAKKEIRIMSLAAGSAQAVVEVLVDLQRYGIQARALLIDREQSALEHAKALAKRYGVEVETVCDSVSRVKRHAKRFQPHIIEMIGFMDYLSHEKAIKLTRAVRESLPRGGWYVTANVMPNFERSFLRWVINWNMVYRSAEELTYVLAEGGFADPVLEEEPLNVHTIAMVRK